MTITIAIIDIIGLPYDGTTVYRQGLGGSESAVTYMSESLAALGFAVTVFNRCNTDGANPGVYNRVQYRPVEELAQDHQFDIVISSRTVIPFIPDYELPNLGDSRALPFMGMNLYDRILSRASMRVLWMHDTFCLGDRAIEPLALADRITDIFTLSDWHTIYVSTCDHGSKRMYEVLKNKIFVTRNGARSHIDQVDLSAKDPNLYVYNASVTKGMIPLVDRVWPRVKQRLPAARLVVIGGYYRFGAAAEPDAQELTWRGMVDDPKYSDLGIEFTGVIPQSEIAQLLAQANFMIYPTSFPETFGISTLESLLYNTPVLTCRFGAMEETAVDLACYKIDYPIEPNSLYPNINTDQQVERFVAMTVQAARNTYLHQQRQYYCNAVKPWACWDTVAEQWRQHFYHQLNEHLPRAAYRSVSRINRAVHEIWGRRTHNRVEIEPHRVGTEREIVVVVPFYNAADYIEQCIASIAAQDYDNYRCVLINDASTDASDTAVRRALAALPQDIEAHFEYVVNSINQGAVYNQVRAIRAVDNPEAIVMLVDGDDSLAADNTIFARYNAEYATGAEFIYGSCWSVVDNIPLISQPYPESVKQNGTYRDHRFNWNMPYTHLRTFVQRLIRSVTDTDFQDSSGQWYRAGGDGSLFYSLIEQARPEAVRCLTNIAYFYNDASPLNDYKVNGGEQTRNANEILARKQPARYTVVVPTMWRAAQQFTKFLAELCEYELVGEIIIIDNDNDAEPDDFQNHPKIKRFVPGENIYVNPAWNLGVEVAQYSRICIVNDDVSFDLRLFDRLADLITPSAGVFGLCPGDPLFDHPPVTDGAIDIVPWTGQHTHGFGCLMFLHRSNWAAIPAELKIYYGDNYIFDWQLSQGRTNYLITNLTFSTPFASTTSDTAITGGFLEREGIVYAEIKANMTQKPAIDTTKNLPAPTATKRILIGIPTAKHIEVDTFKSIYDLIVPEGYTTTFQYFYGYNIDQVRNLIAHWIVNTPYDYLFSVDSDIAFPPDTLVKLLAHDRDAVTGLYIQRKPGQHIVEVYEDNGQGGAVNIEYARLKNRGLVEVTGAGFGCILIKRAVFETIGYPQFKYHSAIDHANTISEDVFFCRRARECGFKIWADTSIKCRHIGLGEFVIDDNIPAAPVAHPVPAKTGSERLRELGSQRLLPQAHVNFLIGLRDAGINPRHIYDIGACVLHWTNEARRIWPHAEYCVFDAMDSVEFLYQEQNLKYHIGVLSDSERVVDFYQNDVHPGGNSYYLENVAVNPEVPEYFNESHRRRLRTETLDSVVLGGDFPLPDLIKIDVQGAELDILKGAEYCLSRCNHVILELQAVEYNTGAPLRDTVIAYMASKGFVCHGLFSNNGPDGDYYFTRSV
jgi:FkbM family methyltransferase